MNDGQIWLAGVIVLVGAGVLLCMILLVVTSVKDSFPEKDGPYNFVLIVGCLGWLALIIYGLVWGVWGLGNLINLFVPHPAPTSDLYPR